jgi:adenosylhomocysteinase
VTEVDAVKALEAAMDGFRVMTMKEAAPLGDVFCTVTGDMDVINGEHFKLMKDAAVVCNSGHFDVEVNVKALEEMAGGKSNDVRNNVKEYVVPATNGGTKRIHLLADGRLVNLAAAEGHPASVMDMSFATQALAAEWVLKHRSELKPQVYSVDPVIEEYVARLKLQAMGINIDTLTPEQQKYLSGWEEGT